MVDRSVDTDFEVFHRVVFTVCVEARHTDIFRIHRNDAARRGNARPGRIADCIHALAHRNRVRIAERYRARRAVFQNFAVFNAEHRDVVILRAADELGFHFAALDFPAVEVNGNIVADVRNRLLAVALRIVNNVIVGDDIRAARRLIQTVNHACARTDNVFFGGRKIGNITRFYAREPALYANGAQKRGIDGDGIVRLHCVDVFQKLRKRSAVTVRLRFFIQNALARFTPFKGGKPTALRALVTKLRRNLVRGNAAVLASARTAVSVTAAEQIAPADT